MTLVFGAGFSCKKRNTSVKPVIRPIRKFWRNARPVKISETDIETDVKDSPSGVAQLNKGCSWGVLGEFLGISWNLLYTDLKKFLVSALALIRIGETTRRSRT